VVGYVVKSKHTAAAVTRTLVLGRSEAVAASIKPAIGKHLRHRIAPVTNTFNQSIHQSINQSRNLHKLTWLQSFIRNEADKE